MDCLIKVTVCTRPFRIDGPRHNSSGLWKPPPASITPVTPSRLSSRMKWRVEFI
jgi:hypothetical protein